MQPPINIVDFSEPRGTLADRCRSFYWLHADERTMVEGLAVAKAAMDSKSAEDRDAGLKLLVSIEYLQREMAWVGRCTDRLRWYDSRGRLRG